MGKASQHTASEWGPWRGPALAERWAEKEVPSKQRDPQAGWRRGLLSPPPVEKETQGDEDVSVGSVPPGRPFQDPVKCGPATVAFIRNVTHLFGESPGREMRQLIRG